MSFLVGWWEARDVCGERRETETGVLLSPRKTQWEDTGRHLQSPSSSEYYYYIILRGEEDDEGGGVEMIKIERRDDPCLEIPRD